MIHPFLSLLSLFIAPLAVQAQTPPSSPQSTESKDRAREASALEGKAQELTDQKRIPEAIAVWRNTAATWKQLGDAPGQVRGWGNVAVLLAAEKPSDADELITQVISVARTAKVENKQCFEASIELVKAGTGFYIDHQMALARRCYEEAAALFPISNPPDTVAEATALENLGLSVEGQNDLSLAEKYYKKALALRLRDKHDASDVANSYNDLGNLSLRQGDSLKAEEWYMKAKSLLANAFPKSTTYANVLNNLGLFYQSQGKLSFAEDYLNQALEIRQNVTGSNSAESMASLCNLGDVLRQKGDFPKSEVYFQQALKICEEKFPNSVSKAGPLMGLGNLALLQGDLDRSETYYQIASDLISSNASYSLITIALKNNLGFVAYAREDWRTAEKNFSHAIEMQKNIAPESAEMAEFLSNLGLVFQKMGHSKDARVRQDDALKIRQKIAPDSLEVANSFNNLGELDFANGDLVSAVSNFEKARLIFHEKSPNTLQEAAVLYNLSELSLPENRRLKPIPSVTFAPYHINPSVISPSVKIRKERLEALDLAQQAWNIIQEQGVKLPDDQAQLAYRANFAEYAYLLLRCQIAVDQSDAAFITFQQSHAQALLQLLVQRQLLGDKTNDNLRSVEFALNRAQQDLSDAVLNGERAKRKLEEARKRNASPAEIASLNKALDEELKKKTTAAFRVNPFSRNRQTLTDAIIASRSDYNRSQKTVATIIKGIMAQIKQPDSLSVVQAQAVLPVDTLYLGYSVGEEESHLFLLAHDRPLAVFTLALPEKKLRAQVEALRDQLAKPDGLPKELGYTLFNTLFPKSVQALLSHYKRLLISPDGVLWEIPFAALNTSPVKLDCLGLQKPILYTPSINVFARSLKEPSRLKSGTNPVTLAAGGMIYNRKTLAKSDTKPTLLASLPGRGERGLLWGSDTPPAPLPNSAPEALTIAKLYKTTPLLGEDATEANIRQLIEKADVVHLSTHGYLVPNYPLTSGVLLTLPAGNEEKLPSENDGALQAWELGRMKLRAELVVFSACETGRGKVIKSEGIEGFTRVLEYAGAKSTVTSLWKVQDDSTAELMERFHIHLRQGERKDDALMLAMRAVSESKQNTGWRNPHEWAGFLLLGDPRNNGLGKAKSKSGK